MAEAKMAACTRIICKALFVLSAACITANFVQGYMFRLAFGTARHSIGSQSFSIPAKWQASSRLVGKNSRIALFMSSERKAGVSSPEELKAFVEDAGKKLLVVDVRNPNPDVEPGDQKSLAVAKLPGDGYRPQAVSLIYDRTTKTMPLPDVEKGTPIITHCGGGGRGQSAKEYLESNGFTNVLNGGGPKETECWAEFGDK